jgi:predicted transcriptional regulator YdeE
MSKKIENKSFMVIGIETRTSNAAEAGPQGIIPSQWGKFMQQNLMEKIPHKTDGAIIAAYTDYETNKDGAYTFFLGTRVSSLDLIPEGMIKRIVPEGSYLKLTTEKGASGKVVFELWQKIWNLHDTNRSYQFDYEVYDQRAMDPNNAEIDIYLGLRNE